MAGYEFENLNMKTATLKQVLRQIVHQLEDDDYTPVCIIGKSGIGKTESISNLAKELGVGFRELRLSHYQESDLIGLPYIDASGITKHAETDLLPPSGDTGKGILLLDEVTSSQKSMRSAVYQLMDSSRKLGQYKLPEKWMIVACGNGPSDGGDFRGIEAAFCSRGFCWRVEPNLEIWKQWALKAGVHPTVIAYLSFRPDKLHCMNPDNPYDMIACPRSWVKLSTQLKNMERRSKGGYISDDEDLEFSAAGCVGATEGPSFAAFYRFNKKTIDVYDILNGKVKPEQMLNVDDEVLYITAQNLVAMMAKDIKESKIEGMLGKVTEPCLNRIVNLMKWCIGLEDAGVRLDVVISIIQDLANALPEDFGNVILDDEFDRRCPEVDEFIMKHGNALSLMGS